LQRDRTWGVRVPPEEPGFIVLLGLPPVPYYVYIIYTETNQRYYCGFTSNLEQRVSQHNNPGFDAAKTTSRFKGPWKLIWKEEYLSKTEALKRERWIKKRGVKRFLHGEKGC